MSLVANEVVVLQLAVRIVLWTKLSPFGNLVTKAKVRLVIQTRLDKPIVRGYRTPVTPLSKPDRERSKPRGPG